MQSSTDDKVFLATDPLGRLLMRLALPTAVSYTHLTLPTKLEV